MNIDNSTLRDLQYVLENLEMSYRINNNLAQQQYDSEFTKGAVWGMEHANSSYTEYLKQLRNIVERVGKGNLYLIEDVNLNGGENHATA